MIVTIVRRGVRCRPGHLAVVMAVGVIVDVSGSQHHGDRGEGADRGRGQPETDSGHRRATTHQGGERCHHRHRPERSADRVGEPGRLVSFQAADARDIDESGEGPGRHGDQIHERGQGGGDATPAHEGGEADAELGEGDRDEETQQRDLVGVHADGGGVDGAGADRAEPGQLHHPNAYLERPLTAREGGRGWPPGGAQRRRDDVGS